MVELLYRHFISKPKCSGILSGWSGGRCVIFPSAAPYYNFSRGIGASLDLGIMPIYDSYHAAGISFVSGWEGYAPFYQEVLQPDQPRQKRLNIEATLERACSDPTLLSSTEIKFLRLNIVFPTYNIREFFPPFEKSFAYGWKVLNIKHPITQDLIRIGAAAELARRQGTLSKGKIGRLKDAMTTIQRNLNHYMLAEDSFKAASEGIRSLYEITAEIPLLQTKKIRGLLPKPEDFVPGTFSSKRKVEPRHPSALVSFGKPME